MSEKQERMNVIKFRKTVSPGKCPDCQFVPYCDGSVCAMWPSLRAPYGVARGWDAEPWDDDTNDSNPEDTER